MEIIGALAEARPRRGLVEEVGVMLGSLDPWILVAPKSMDMVPIAAEGVHRDLMVVDVHLVEEVGFWCGRRCLLGDLLGHPLGHHASFNLVPPMATEHALERARLVGGSAKLPHAAAAGVDGCERDGGSTPSCRGGGREKRQQGLMGVSLGVAVLQEVAGGALTQQPSDLVGAVGLFASPCPPLKLGLAHQSSSFTQASSVRNETEPKWDDLVRSFWTDGVISHLTRIFPLGDHLSRSVSLALFACAPSRNRSSIRQSPSQITAPADLVQAMARPPYLIDDAITEILLRLPPDDPACLVRASLVCKAWRELLTGPAFLRRYCAFHGAPPLLGYSHNIYDEVPYARFVAADARASPFSAPAFGRLNWWVLECRHGRVLLQSFERHASSNLLVWDPITGVQHQVPVHMTYFCHTAAVLCGVAGCDHLNCHGGPFLVVSICIPYEEEEEQAVDFISACVYSSETGAWTSSPSIQFDAYIEERPSLLARDALYFTLRQGRRILKYDLVGQGLLVIDAPDMFDGIEGIVVAAEDGGLGLAGLVYGDLHLWSWQAGPCGVADSARFSPLLDH
ncbi:hypothetical protein HU200_005320 [Digitaria exilis]|uniref:F-box domain-containing protein n=1 Tax=Digitaria exilis TaxID=1010633 RepID=A0A835KT40_9POAL|nr:hypothetical protein HU200_005320 [Digitaria exilis]